MANITESEFDLIKANQKCLLVHNKEYNTVEMDNFCLVELL